MRPWKKIPEDAGVVLTGGMKEEVLFPEDSDPDFIVRGMVIIDGKPIKADIGLFECVSGFNECFHELNPRLFREVGHETEKA